MTKTVSLLSLCSTFFVLSLTADTSMEHLYQSKCASCHGKQGEVKALNTSRPINTLSQEQIVTALDGYKDGSYGGQYKMMKKGIVRRLNPDEINELAHYITTLKTAE